VYVKWYCDLLEIAVLGTTSFAQKDQLRILSRSGVSSVVESDLSKVDFGQTKNWIVQIK
jgi:hypothetical protein